MFSKSSRGGVSPLYKKNRHVWLIGLISLFLAWLPLSGVEGQANNSQFRVGINCGKDGVGTAGNASGTAGTGSGTTTLTANPLVPSLGTACSGRFASVGTDGLGRTFNEGDEIVFVVHRVSILSASYDARVVVDASGTDLSSGEYTIKTNRSGNVVRINPAGGNAPFSFFTITLNADATTGEGQEKLLIKLQNVTGADRLSPEAKNTGSGFQVLDNGFNVDWATNNPPAGMTVVEGGSIVATITRAGFDGAATVSIVGSGSGIDNDDYTINGTTPTNLRNQITFSESSSTATISVSVKGNTDTGADPESLTLTVQETMRGSIPSSAWTVTLEDPPPVWFKLTAMDATEPDQNGAFTIALLDAPNGNTVTAKEEFVVKFTRDNGQNKTTPLSAMDLDVVIGNATGHNIMDGIVPMSSPVEGSVTFQVGASTATYELEVKDDTELEGDLPITMTLSLPAIGESGYKDNVNLVMPAVATAYIRDDDGPKVSIEVEDPDSPGNNYDDEGAGKTPLEVEENATITFAVSVASSPQSNLSIPLTVAGLETGEYSIDPAMVTFNSGATGLKKMVTITLIDDADYEMEETLTVSLGNSDQYLVPGTGTGNYLVSEEHGSEQVIVEDNEYEVSFRAATNISLSEGADASITVSVSSPQSDKITVNLVASGTAMAEDYSITGVNETGTAGTYDVVIPSMANSATINVTIVNDDVFEEDKGMLLLTLDSTMTETPAQVIGTNNVATINLADNVMASEVSVSIAAGENAEEGSTEGSFTVSTSKLSVDDIIISYTISADGAATADDFNEPLSGSVTINALQSSAVISVTAKLDDEDEGDGESLVLELTGVTQPMGGSLGSESSATIQIMEKRAQPKDTGSVLASQAASLNLGTAFSAIVNSGVSGGLSSLNSNTGLNSGDYGRLYVLSSRESDNPLGTVDWFTFGVSEAKLDALLKGEGTYGYAMGGSELSKTENSVTGLLYGIETSDWEFETESDVKKTGLSIGAYYGQGLKNDLVASGSAILTASRNSITAQDERTGKGSADSLRFLMTGQLRGENRVLENGATLSPYVNVMAATESTGGFTFSDGRTKSEKSRTTVGRLSGGLEYTTASDEDLGRFVIRGEIGQTFGVDKITLNDGKTEYTPDDDPTGSLTFGWIAHPVPAEFTAQINLTFDGLGNSDGRETRLDGVFERRFKSGQWNWPF